MNAENVPAGGFAHVLKDELQHIRSHWLWIFLLGVLLVLAGTAAIIVPPATVGTTFAAVIFLGVLLMVAGVATIASSFWIGKWSGFLVQLLVGILYVACGFVVTENPAISAFTMTLFIAMSFVVLGIFRSVGALVLRFPEWGWSLLNGVVTLLAGVVIFRQLPFDALWVIGLLIGLEMLFNGWTWIMLGLTLRRIPQAT
ncbi:MAG: HdeD family acid-resistance protein [Pirellulales bacterium]